MNKPPIYQCTKCGKITRNPNRLCNQHQTNAEEIYQWDAIMDDRPRNHDSNK